MSKSCSLVFIAYSACIWLMMIASSCVMLFGLWASLHSFSSCRYLSRLAYASFRSLQNSFSPCMMAIGSTLP